MAKRCPVCYEVLDETFFKKSPAIWCYEEQVLGENAELKKLRKHGDREPSANLALISAEAINNKHYRPLALAHPAWVRSITLSGKSESGKGTWLLSLTWLLHYPYRTPRLKMAFPADWSFSYEDCSMADFTENPTGAANPLRQLENLFADGNAPIRTAANVHAMRCPILFQCGGKGRFSQPRQAILIFNDIAGEIIGRPLELARSEYFPHVGATTDVVFLVAADELDSAAFFLSKFASALGVVRFEETTVDISKVNLILAISQIDKLKHGTPQEQKLLKVLLRPPCELPCDPHPEEVRQYFSAMESVHHDLEHWFGLNMPTLLDEANQFASVRYCGFSSFGFGLIVRGKGDEREAALPFGPQPVRVADPLFWLLRDNGVIQL